jgi:hypothetical protein
VNQAVLSPLRLPTVSVSFNGQNGYSAVYRGAGYSMRVRLARAGYLSWDDEPSPRRFWKQFHRLFRDLATLQADFRLTVALREQGGSWRSLEEVRQLLRAKGGWPALRGCLVHVYGPADYLERWRKVLCDRARIRPRERQHAHNRRLLPAPVRDGGAWLKAQLERVGWGLREAAGRLGVSHTLLSRVITGKRGLSDGLRRQVESLLGGGSGDTQGSSAGTGDTLSVPSPGLVTGENGPRA